MFNFKNKNMKNIKHTIFGCVLVLGLATSCSKDELDIQPTSSIAEAQYFKNDADILGAVIAIYDGMQAVPKREFAVTEMRSDNGTTLRHEGEYKQLETFDVDPTNSVSSGYYTANYNVVFRANIVLENINVMTDAGKKVNYDAEAKFARALSYFNLVRAYGEVPLITKVIRLTDADYKTSDNFAKKSVASIYTLIEEDLKVAVLGLPSKTGTTFGRATKEAAQGLLAKVYLTEKKYTDALPLLTTLVASTQYSLQAAYTNIFYTEGNSEIMFAIPYTASSSTESQDFSAEMTISGVANGLDYVTDNFRAFMTANAADQRTATNILNVPTTNKAYGQNNKFTSTLGKIAGNDWIVLRLADVYLMYTEAIMGTATSTIDADAIKYYDKVRNRAFTVPVTSLIVTKAMLLDQRRAEFAYENQRLYDLIRFDQAQTVLSAYSTTFQGPKDLLLPLPQSEINSSFGKLIQNPLY
tara:strand:+ start:18565 stop:19971 length:1407 start_codon:yes stop_codon:yes gene_type:complete